ncbi:MAG: DUF58 domain-containing protein [Chloroflexota bacterium]
MSDPILFDESFMRKLEQLSLVVRRIKRLGYKGERRSTRRGQSVEFADYRNYVKGDDLRALDWNIYARLERPFIKLFEEEVDQTVHILFDTSASMNWPQISSLTTQTPDENKWQFTRRLVAALGYIALSNNDRLFVSGLSDANAQTWGPERRKQSIHRLLKYLADCQSTGQTNLNQTLKAYAQRAKRPGLLFIISDFLSNDDYQAGLNMLQNRGHEIAVLHLLSPDEIDPVLSGDFQLRDVETDTQQDLTINATLKRLYRQHFETWQNDIQQFCQRRNINYVLINTDQPFETLILRFLRQRGFIY